MYHWYHLIIANNNHTNEKKTNNYHFAINNDGKILCCWDNYFCFLVFGVIFYCWVVFCFVCMLQKQHCTQPIATTTTCAKNKLALMFDIFCKTHANLPLRFSMFQCQLAFCGACSCCPNNNNSSVGKGKANRHTKQKMFCYPFFFHKCMWLFFWGVANINEVPFAKKKNKQCKTKKP